MNGSEMVDRIVVLLKEKYISKSKFIEDCQLSSNILTKWKTGVIPNSSTLYTVSKYLGVTMEYLLEGEVNTDLITLQLVSDFNKLSDRDKKIIKAQIKTLSELE